MSNNPFKAIYNAIGSYAKWVDENQREWDAYEKYGPNWRSIIEAKNLEAAEKILALQERRRKFELEEAKDFARTGMRATDRTAPYVATIENGREVRRYDFSPSEPHATGKSRAEVIAEQELAEEREKALFEQMLEGRKRAFEERKTRAELTNKELERRAKEAELADRPEKERIARQKALLELASGKEDLAEKRFKFKEEQEGLKRRREVAKAMVATGEFRNLAEAEAFIDRAFVPQREKEEPVAAKRLEREIRQERVLAYANTLVPPVELEDGTKVAAYGKLEDVPSDIRQRAENAVFMQTIAEKEREPRHPKAPPLQLNKAEAKPVNLRTSESGLTSQDQEFLKRMQAKRARGETPTEEEFARLKRLMPSR
jgi:hypothetical protein